MPHPHTHTSSSVLLAIGTAVPEFSFGQAAIADFMLETIGLTHEEGEGLQKVYANTGIETRYSVLADFGRPPEAFTFFSPGAEPDTRARMAQYDQAAPALGAKAVQACLRKMGNITPQDVTHLITVSCTGMAAPGLDIALVNLMGMNPSVERTCINFMGCYAAINALKAADYIVRAEHDALVLVVAVELCTLHFHPNPDRDQTISQAIFADGAAAALVGSGSHNTTGRKLKLKKFYAEIAPQGQNDMSWQVGANGFDIHLSAYVPKLIRRGIGDLVDRLKARTSIDKLDLFAIHPGGVRILEACQRALNIPEGGLDISHDVLRQFGNMSSATVLFVLEQFMRTLTPEAAGKNMLATAFGPGLTMEAAILEVC